MVLVSWKHADDRDSEDGHGHAHRHAHPNANANANAHPHARPVLMIAPLAIDDAWCAVSCERRRDGSFVVHVDATSPLASGPHLRRLWHDPRADCSFEQCLRVQRVGEEQGRVRLVLTPAAPPEVVATSTSHGAVPRT